MSAMYRAQREKQKPTKLLQFSCDSTDLLTNVKPRNNSHNRSQIFYAGRQDCWLDKAPALNRKPGKSPMLSQVKIEHTSSYNDQEKAALARGRR